MTAYLRADHRYVRTRGGRVIHLAGCKRLEAAKHARPWKWAAGKTPTEIANELFALGIFYHWCHVCFPTDAAPNV